MDSNGLFHLQGADLVIIVLIVLLLFGARKSGDLARHMGEELRNWQGDSREYPEAEKRLQKVNRWLTLLAVAFFLLACSLWIFGPPE